MKYVFYHCDGGSQQKDQREAIDKIEKHKFVEDEEKKDNFEVNKFVEEEDNLEFSK